MKKLLAAITLVMYFMVSTGFAVSIHYCMDKLDSVQIGAEHDDVCNKCGMETGNKKCCWDEVQVLKLQTTHMASQALVADFTAPTAIVIHQEFLLNPFRNYKQADHAVATDPPPDELPLTIKNCVFRI
jgi:hypothetical protein